jgi:hypothetical protein
MKRPSTLQVGNTAARIRKSSGNKQELDQSIEQLRESIRIQEEAN